MSLSALPLCWCSNVHPGRTADEVLAQLKLHAEGVGRLRKAKGAEPSVGLWLSRTALGDPPAPDLRTRLREWIASAGFAVHTFNAFPFGDFHGDRVKEAVYRPDWSDPARPQYTLAAAELLADLLPEHGEGSISTLPVSYKAFGGAGAAPPSAPDPAVVKHLLSVAAGLHKLYRRTGRRVRLAVEPEPLCTVETADEAAALFAALFAAADRQGLEPLARDYLGVCWDVCHQAVEYEAPEHFVATLSRAGVRINKVQLSVAVELPSPADNAEGRRRLAEFVEPRYLHQTFARTEDGTILRAADLTAGLCGNPPAEWLEAESWRVHFHVPVGTAEIGPLKTTQPDLKRALAAVARLPYAPHLEVETYTWSVLPAELQPKGGQGVTDLAAGIAAELDAVDEMIAAMNADLRRRAGQ